MLLPCNLCSPAGSLLFSRRSVASTGSGGPTLPFVEAETSATNTSSSASDSGPDSNAVAVIGSRIYRRERPEHHRVFRWGIGNKFRMQSKNRFSPVHKPHPTQVTIRDDYYESDNPDIIWENLNESWEVHWYEHSKLNSRPFMVKKFGIERAKREAFEFWEALGEAGRRGDRSATLKMEAQQPGEPGIFFDYRMQGWVSLFWRAGRPVARTYSARKWGFDGAKMLAEAKQKDPVNGLYHTLGGGGTPVHLKKMGRGL